MCGISGIVEIKLSKTEFYKLAETLLLELETRGKDATGIYTAGRVKKAPIKASDFIKFLPRTFGTVLSCITEPQRKVQSGITIITIQSSETNGS